MERATIRKIEPERVGNNLFSYTKGNGNGNGNRF
jgi:hypothetical protein